MKKALLTLVAIVLGVAVFFIFIGPEKTEAPDHITTTDMEISSKSFNHNEPIPSKYTCDGQNINPQLTFSKFPENTQSFALVVDDPDAPAGTWVHWVLWNIDPTTTEILEDSVPAGSVQGTTSFGDLNYGGPCPPSGTHRYFFKLYALDSPLELAPKSTAQELEIAITPHIIEQTELVGLYSRSQ